ncbi:MAG: SDR family oxidoreductase [Ardenticatenaceae bacterium]|nr:SDR family oxidoreductase [Ardenticatenaceae bacterium]
MNGKVCIVTGANAGIGKATAVGLAQRGATVVMVCRSRERGETAQQEIADRSGSQDLHLLMADLASQAEIRQVAQAILSQFPRVDVLINNAAVIPLRRSVSVDGLELQLAVNHLAPFLLTNLLLERLKTSAPSRIINVSSGVHRGATLPFDDLQSKRHYHHTSVYATTKLMNVIFTKALARRLAGSGVTAYALHPGVPATKLSTNYAGYEGQERASFADLMHAAQTSIFLATAPDLADLSGEYFANSRVQESTAVANDPDIAQKLWQVSAQLTNL